MTLTNTETAEYPEAIPQDIREAAAEVMSQYRWFNEEQWGDFIAKAILAERQRCANVASHFMGSLWSSDQNHAASIIFNEIAHPAAPVEGA